MVQPAKRIRNIKKYSITPQEIWFKENKSNIQKLDWNESPRNLDIFIDEFIKLNTHPSILSWYPDYNCTELKEAIVKYSKLEEENICVFTGSDSALIDICNCYVEEEDQVLCFSPTYDNFRVFAKQHGGIIKDFELDNNGHPCFKKLKKELDYTKPKIVYIVHPVNPFGNYICKEELAVLIKKYSNILFVVDEAYIDFDLNESYSSYIEEFENLVITRTFSKAFGLAGMRIGYTLSSTAIAESLNKIRLGKNVSMIGQYLAKHALNSKKFFNDWFSEINNSKIKYYEFFETNNIKYHKSYANFILFYAKKCSQLIEDLRERNIYVRDRSKIIKDGIRISVGDLDSTKTVIKLFNQKKHLF